MALGHRFFGEGRRFTFRVALLSMHSSRVHGMGWSSEFTSLNVD